MTFPDDLLYHAEHLWVRRLDGAEVTIGISDFAQDQLGKVVYVDLPEEEDELEAGSEMGAIESAKSVSDLIAPVSGVVLEVNAALDDDPSPLNNDPYGAGWLARIKLNDPSELDSLMDAAAYKAAIG